MYNTMATARVSFTKKKSRISADTGINGSSAQRLRNEHRRYPFLLNVKSKRLSPVGGVPRPLFKVYILLHRANNVKERVSTAYVIGGLSLQYVLTMHRIAMGFTDGAGLLATPPF